MDCIEKIKEHQSCRGRSEMSLCNLYEILSPQERKVWYLKSAGLDRKEIAEELNTNFRYVAVCERRIKRKIEKLNAQGILIDGSTDLSNAIEEIFNAEQNRVLPQKTVNQAIFLQDLTAHSLGRRESEAERRMQYRLGIKKKKDNVITRKCTQEEMDSFQNEVAAQRIPQSIMKMKQNYDYFLATGEGDTEDMGRMETILRSYGVLYFTPHANKLNSKTGFCQRAMVSDTVIVVKDGESLDFPNPKFIESTTNEDGEIERVYIIEGKPSKFNQRKGNNNEK